MSTCRLGARWPLRLVAALLSCAMGLVLTEAIFREWKWKQLTVPAGIEHPHFHHRLRPYETYHFASEEFDVSIRTNKFGLRGSDPILPKPEGTIRILMLGDSFTFGFPVKDEETFSAQVARELTAQGYKVEVVNGGVSGYSPTLHYVSLRDEFLAFAPDLAILWFDLGDLQEDQWFQKNLVYDQGGRIARCDPGYVNGHFSRWEWLRGHSALAKYVDNKVLRTVYKLRVLGPWGYLKVKLRGERAKVAIAKLKAAQHAADLAAYDKFLLVRETTTEESIQPYWSLSAKYLAMIHELLDEHGIPFMLGVYPYGMLAGPDQWAGGRTFWGFEAGKTYDSRVMLAVLSKFSSRERIPLINTFDSFREAAKSRTLFYPWDGHMTPEGHHVLATHLVRDRQFRQLLASVEANVRARRHPVRTAQAGQGDVVTR